MTATDPQPTKPALSFRWFHLTPDRVVMALLAVEVLMWLSDWFGWLPWHKGYAVLSAVATVGVVMVFMGVWFAVAVLFRRRFQFSIRSLLVLTVVVAVPSSWLAVEMKKAKKQREAVEAIRMAEGWVDYDWMPDPMLRRLNDPVEPPGPEWLRNLLGIDFFSEVGFVILQEDNEDVFEQLRGWPRLHVLDFTRTKVTAATLAHLERLTELQVLYINGTEVTDAGLEHLEGLSQLQNLFLHDTQVTDAGVKKLQQALPNCKISR